MDALLCPCICLEGQKTELVGMNTWQQALSLTWDRCQCHSVLTWFPLRHHKGLVSQGFQRTVALPLEPSTVIVIVFFCCFRWDVCRSTSPCLAVRISHTVFQMKMEDMPLSGTDNTKLEVGVKSLVASHGPFLKFLPVKSVCVCVCVFCFVF